MPGITGKLTAESESLSSLSTNHAIDVITLPTTKPSAKRLIILLSPRFKNLT
jgi:hypothetical protein